LLQIFALFQLSENKAIDLLREFFLLHAFEKCLLWEQISFNAELQVFGRVGGLNNESQTTASPHKTQSRGHGVPELLLGSKLSEEAVWNALAQELGKATELHVLLVAGLKVELNGRVSVFLVKDSPADAKRGPSWQTHGSGSNLFKVIELLWG
jgi:hypothetical protein